MGDRSIEAACADLEDAPHPNTIRGYLAQQWQPDQLPALQEQCNAALHAALPTASLGILPGHRHALTPEASRALAPLIGAHLAAAP